MLTTKEALGSLALVVQDAEWYPDDKKNDNNSLVCDNPKTLYLLSSIGKTKPDIGLRN